MSMTGAGAYLRVLREARGLSRAEMADRLGATETNLWRIEEDGQEPKAGLLIGFLNEVRGTSADFWQLLKDTTADESAGRALAEARVSRFEYAKLQELQSLLGDDRLASLVERLASEPDLVDAIDRLTGAGHGPRR